MGTANKKAEYAKEKLTFDFTGPDVFVPEGERHGLRERGDANAILRQAAGLVLAEHHQVSTALSAIAAERANLPEADAATIDYPARAVKHLIRSVVQAAFPKSESIEKKDRARYRHWQRCIEFESPSTAALTVADVDWLRELLDKDKIGLHIESSGWAEDVLDYCEALLERTLAAAETRHAG